jgi:hypothetical protein
MRNNFLAFILDEVSQPALADNREYRRAFGNGWEANVASAILADVEPGFQPGGKTATIKMTLAK